MGSAQRRCKSCVNLAGDPPAPPPGYRTDLATFVVQGSQVMGCFAEDNLWYPAVVDALIPGEGTEPTQYFVTYKDYGTSELLPPSRVAATRPLGQRQGSALARVQKLMAMGFDESHADDALHITGEDIVAAVEACLRK